MKKWIIAALFPMASATTVASETKLTAAESISVDQPRQLPYEIVIGSGCPYNYDHMNDVVEHVFKRKRVNSLWETGTKLASSELYLSISVECVVVTERNKSYTTSIQFARYDESPLAHGAEYGRDGYGSDRLFNKRLSESVDGALEEFLQANRRRG